MIRNDCDMCPPYVSMQYVFTCQPFTIKKHCAWTPK